MSNIKDKAKDKSKDKPTKDKPKSENRETKNKPLQDSITKMKQEIAKHEKNSKGSKEEINILESLMLDLEKV